ncbi:MAG: glycine--tRNA ligase subunit beta [Geothrix sp.]|nr:glycine--tRNA ligase subunit beta [Geothrix sp.]
MSGTRTFLLELHCEEIPARFLAPLAEDFSAAFTAWANSKGIGALGLEAFYSPRKLAWRVQGLPVAQSDQTETQVGPPQRMCVDEAGKPTIQGLKFAEKWGVDFGAVRFEQPAGKKEPCAVVTITKQGRPTMDLLAEALPGLIAGLHVPKAMRWGKSEFEFVRPIRNLLCLFGEQVVPITVDGVAATATTWGHRLFHRQHPEPVEIQTPGAYETALEAAGVVVSVNVRRARIAEQLDQLAAEAGGRVVADAELLDTLAEIVEFPKIVRGDFPADFLELPKEVLVTSLREHQKSFCIENAKGELLPRFLTAANRPDDPEGFVKAGNEWVLKARLYDARFFFAEDRKQPLSERLEKLKALTFQRELGSYYDKTGRVVALTKALATRLSNDDDHINAALEAARMAKCDLRTLMVGEFPELQGVMGGEYLKGEGADPEVWMAVKEQYRPAGAEDAIPGTPMGCLLSLCDKLDTVVGCFAVGLIPSGSKDPLALRRAGQGIVRILWEQGWAFTPGELAASALRVVGTKATKPAAETTEALQSFFRDRVAYQLDLAGYVGSVRRSALAAGWEDLADLKARCEALSAFAEDTRFASLAQSAKRIGNILKDEVPAERFDGGLLTQGEEKVLAERLEKLESTPDQASLLAALADLAEPLEAFFNAVMVKCEDEKLRAARLSLLHRLRRAFLRVADFSLWQ